MRKYKWWIKKEKILCDKIINVIIIYWNFMKISHFFKMEILLKGTFISYQQKVNAWQGYLQKTQLCYKNYTWMFFYEFPKDFPHFKYTWISSLLISKILRSLKCALMPSLTSSIIDKAINMSSRFCNSLSCWDP